MLNNLLVVIKQNMRREGRSSWCSDRLIAMSDIIISMLFLRLHLHINTTLIICRLQCFRAGLFYLASLFIVLKYPLKCEIA